MTTTPDTTISTTTPSGSKDGVVVTVKAKTKPIKRMKTKGKLSMTKEERREKYTTIARQRQNNKKLKTVICYQCRQRGHSIQNCPNNKNKENSSEQINDVGRENDDNDDEPNIDKEQQQQQPSKKLQKKLKRQQQQRDKNFMSSSSPICYKCGSTEHTLAKCPKRNVTNKRHYDDNTMDANGECIVITNELLPYAKCFICQQNGHLASNCPQNKHGVYVTGNGCCRICQSKQHRVSDCPEKNRSKTIKVNDDDNPNMYFNNSDIMNDDENDILNQKNNGDKNKSNDNTNKNNITGTNATPKKRKVIKF